MKQELEQDKYKGLGNGTWNEGYFPTAKQECIWDIPEDKRHCEYCTANCVNAHAVSTPTELEQAAGEFAAKAAPMTAEDACFNSFRIIALRELLTRAFKAGAEWMKKQQFCERNYIKGFNAAVERIEVELLQMKKKYKEED